MLAVAPIVYHACGSADQVRMPKRKWIMDKYYILMPGIGVELGIIYFIIILSNKSPSTDE